MSRVHSISITNFRGIKEFRGEFNTDFVCLIGRGDSGKSTILEAIAVTLSGNWNVNFFDNDFHNCDTNNPIVIEVTLIDVPSELIAETKFGMHLKAYDAAENRVYDEPEKADGIAITVQLMVEKDLEPKWNVITNRESGNKTISAADRTKFNAFLVSDLMDRHFYWGKGSPLYSLLRNELNMGEDDDVLIDLLRVAKGKIDVTSFSKFDSVISKVKASAAVFGIDISRSLTTIDFKDFLFRDGKLSLHDESIPFRLKGKGSKRLISMTIQALIAGNGGLVLIDEIEQGLEPDRVQNLINILAKNNTGQVFITTHSRDVLVEVQSEKLYLIRKDERMLLRFPAYMQGVCRKNPEAFFAKKIIVAEGATEIGVCRALHEFRLANGKRNMAYLGVRVADGSGTQMIDYVMQFKLAKFSVCLFCDSDTDEKDKKKDYAKRKESLRKDNIPVFDWDQGDNLETAIIKEIPFTAIPILCRIAAEFKVQENGSTLEKVNQSFFAAIRSRFSNCPENFYQAADSPELRSALAGAAVKQQWFKSQEKGKALGKVVFDHFDQLGDGTLKRQLTALNNWIDS